MTNEQRVQAASIMDYLVQHAVKVHYAQVRPMRTRTIHDVAALKKQVASPAGVTMDCSESVTLILRLVGVGDPNGLHFNGEGNTSTLYDHLSHYTKPAGANIGALVRFGPGYGEHVCMVRTPGTDPLLFSHGEESGPFYIRLSEERRYHTPPVTFLSVAKL